MTVLIKQLEPMLMEVKGQLEKISIPDGACGRIDALKKWNLKL